MADTLKDRLRGDLNHARKDRDRLKTMLLSTVLAEVRNHEIHEGRDAGDPDVITVLSRAIKQRKEAAQQARDGGRADLADKEEKEAELLGEYMPAAMAEDEVRSLVRAVIEAGADNIGAVMGRVMPELRGRFDGGQANRIAREELDRAGNG